MHVSTTGQAPKTSKLACEEWNQVRVHTQLTAQESTRTGNVRIKSPLQRYNYTCIYYIKRTKPMCTVQMYAQMVVV